MCLCGTGRFPVNACCGDSFSCACLVLRFLDPVVLCMSGMKIPVDHCVVSVDVIESDMKVPFVFCASLKVATVLSACDVNPMALCCVCVWCDSSYCAVCVCVCVV